MPTTKPRINVTVSQEVYDVYRGLSDLQGRSMSAIVNEILTETLPHMSRMLSALNMLKLLPAETVQKIADQYSTAESDVHERLAKTLQDFDAIEGAFADAVRQQQPPYINKGVTNPSIPKNPEGTKALKIVSTNKESSK